MRTTHIKSTLLSFIVVSAVAVPFVLGAPSPSTQTPAPMASASKKINGKVEAKSDSSLTVNGTAISFSATTSFSKGGSPIKADDIKVGDNVRVTTSEDGSAAVTIEVVPDEAK